MKSGHLIVVVLLISVAFAGCSEPPSSPVSELPKIVIDYEHKLEEKNSTIIFIHGMDEIRYTNISIYINESRVLFQNETFSAEHKTNLTHFNLTVNVWLNKEWYNYNATYKVSQKEDMIYKITYSDGETKKVKPEDLPYVERANFMEEEENA